MNKFICTDTNIFIQCCLLESEDDTAKILDRLIDSLNNDQNLKLLLPEVIELEFFRVLEEKTTRIEEKVNKIIDEIERDQSLQDGTKNKIALKLNAFVADLESNKAESLEKIKTIFGHSNTIKIGITPEALTNAYKYFIHKGKPFSRNLEDRSKKDTSIQQDCLIIELLRTFLKNERDYEFYFCSDNSSDFAAEVTTNSETAIHSDIKKYFNHIELYETLYDLFNKKFGSEYPEKVIEEAKKITGEIVESYSVSREGITDESAQSSDDEQPLLNNANG